jgi:molybdate transport system permease protein
MNKLASLVASPRVPTLTQRFTGKGSPKLHFAPGTSLITLSVLVIALPLARPGFITASVLGFAHTVGEFGVVLMIGGNIPGVTRVVSVQLYDHVEALDYAQAHWLAASLLVFSFVVLAALYGFNRRADSHLLRRGS